MAGLVDQYGRPLSTQNFKKATPPSTKPEAFGAWAGRDLAYLELPGGGTIGFDLNRLTLSDFRKMTSHYQIHASLSVLSFMQHQAEWSIECSDSKIKKFCEEQLQAVWTQLTRAFSTANWAGFSPNVLAWENDSQGRQVVLAKIKDLVPEDCFVNWKEVEGYAPPGKIPPKRKIYDGIKQVGEPYPIPVEATVWYPLLMENGDHYGKKLLKPAFTSWYFSMLLHLFANRYYERFGEPTPIGRAPMEDEVVIGDTTLSSRDYMLKMLQNIRSRSAVVLPNDRNPQDSSSNANRSYDYEIDYLESQMRGADFERYMTRLDEEMSIGLFTPILLLRTADVGSYNLGVGHMQVYLWMLNALNGDRKFYMDNYILNRMVDFNFSPNAPRARIVFRKMGNSNQEMLQTVLQTLLSKDKAGVNLDQLGELVGLKLTEVRQLTAPAADPADGGDPNDPTGSPSDSTPTDTANNIKERVGSQVFKAFEQQKWGSDLRLDIGFRKKLRNQFHLAGVDPSHADKFFRTMDNFVEETVKVPFDSGDQYMQVFGSMLDRQLEAALHAV